MTTRTAMFVPKRYPDEPIAKVAPNASGESHYMPWITMEEPETQA